MNINLKFEYITRKVFDCERFDYPGANTDLYDNLNLKNSSFQTHLRLGRIVSALEYALDKIDLDYFERFNEDELDKLKERISDLSDENVTYDILNSFVTDFFDLLVASGF